MKQFLFVLYVAVLIVMGTATFVESAEGSSFVHQHFYGAWWFAALWAALAVVGVICIIKSKERRFNVLLLHASFLIILTGALLTHLTGQSGTICLRLNEPQNVAIMEHNGKQSLQRLDFAVKLTDFKIVEDEEGNVIDYRSDFKIIPQSNYTAHHSLESGLGVKASVSMNNIAKYGSVRFYQMSYDNDLCGSTLIINHDPYGIPVTYCGYILLFISFISLCLKKTGSLRIWLSSIALTVAWCIYYFILDGRWLQMPVLRHPLLFVHVIVIIMAYALLLIQTITSAVWLVKNRKNKSFPLGLCKVEWRERFALCLLSIGIFLGAIWANISWGNYWSWDSKEVWALITLMVYALPVHRSSLPVFQNPRVLHIYMIIAFLTVLMTYFGVSYMLPGMHSYI